MKFDIAVCNLKERLCDHLRFEMQSKMHLRLECKLKVSVRTEVFTKSLSYLRPSICSVFVTLDKKVLVKGGWVRDILIIVIAP